MAPTTTNPQLPSKISRLPEEILYQNFNQGSQGTFLRSGMRTYEFQIAKTNLEDRVAQFRFLFDRSLKDFPRPNEEEILKKMFERKCIEARALKNFWILTGGNKRQFKRLKRRLN